MRGGYDNRGGHGFNHKGDRDQPRRDRGGGNREPPVFGIVISMKEVFGFLQPLVPVPGEEHLYFNDKDVFGERLHEGDEVQFVLRHGPRGPVAAQVRRLEGGVKIKKAKVLGIVEKEADQYKFSPGLIGVSCFPHFSPDGAEVEVPEGTVSPPQAVPFMPVDVSKGSRRIMKGDEVEFDLYVIPEAPRQDQGQRQAGGPWKGYSRGHSIKLVRTRNDRLIAEQIKELESSGVAREQGVIDTIKNDFGFVRPADRQEQIFFRLEDVLDAKQHIPNEGDEVDFYVISETVKGRVSDRAVHLKYLPHGTVQFEETLDTEVRAVVIVEPLLQPREEPGLLQLCKPLTREGQPAIETVELWSRCLPEGLGFMKCGDELELDVTKYRPEKLIFARNVKVCSYRSLGRAYGAICDIKTTGGYGFIRSVQGDPDCYFRSSEVLGDDGTLIPEKRLRTGQRVSYEIVMESVRGGGSKLRAVRVQTCTDASFRPRKAILQKDVHGTIVREARKGDHHAVGSIELSEALLDPQIPCYEVFTSHQDLFCALQDFRDNKHWKEVTLGHMQPYQRYALHALLRHHFTGIAHATVEGKNGKKSKGSADSDVQVLSLTEDNLNTVTNSVATASAAANSLAGPNDNDSPTKGKGRKSPPADDDSSPQEVRIWKIEDPVEFAEWSKTNDVLLQGSSRWNSEGATSNIVSFQKSDLVDNLGMGGGARAGSDVSFDVCVDRVTGARVAANVKVSDVQAEGGEWPQLGCLEFFRADGDMHGGYIRCVPSDEKLMWNQLGRSTEDNATAEKGGREEWKLGSVVSFEIRVRGGVRYAAGVAVVPPESELAPQAEIELEGEVHGVVVETPQVKGGGAPGAGLSVYVVNTTNCPSMKNKIVDLAGAVQVVKQKALIHGAGTFSASDNASWEKKQLQDPGGDVEAEKKDKDQTQKKSAKAEKLKDESSTPQMNMYPPLPGAVLPIHDDANSPEGLAVGNFVQCRLVANWFCQRLPLYVSKITVVPSKTTVSSTTSTEVPTATTALANLVVTPEDTTPPGRVRGTIIRLKINSTLGFDVSEISLNDQYRKSGAGEDNLFYCDTRDLRGGENGSGRDKSGSAAHVGDVVEFVPVPELCVAACPVVVKGMSRIGQGAAVPTTTRRNVFNSQLQGGPTAGVKSITMAEGPQGDSIGFTPGWRGPVDVKDLPWGHLLGHLVTEEKAEVQATVEEVS
eukprot:CAMPEP_0114425774 /NCGR_PEP_ID=MMETSP0103-20121206/7420_1 /TAXON_ID=37642 ORGANISM="Paraphysomonas imperforata, Strain PA2" /NCGR_SAMPLE_ID=MMETSP0103 /ASSEMBLY_ACC=CAM_ASM_000201 /LENGTH=1204 /DNA_ID=CAMNT_0001594643 /DNA_START=179 /DNA_END=3793 /DNA_ORIENTATION=-